MRLSQFFIHTLKEPPQEAQLISHQLMLRSGMIKSTASGIYSWLPLGLRVLRKVENIVREEMNKAGAIELHMPMTQPADLWQESGRWQAYGNELLRFKDRHDRDFCLGPTHEEVISDIVRRDIQSYRQLPFNLYQIQTKFRDEVRPRFGVMRCREFLMKDAYSFHLTADCLSQTYADMVQAYRNIFQRIGLDYRSVSADTGSIGGDTSHEFHVLAESGEDGLAFSNQSSYCANVELAESICHIKRPKASAEMQLLDTPNSKTIAAVAEFLSLPQEKCIKLLMVEGVEDEVVALILRGDHQLNEVKATKHPLIKSPLTFANPIKAQQFLGADIGSLGPVKPVSKELKIIVDHYAYVLADFCCGANQNDKHYINVNWGRDCPEPESYDLRVVEQGDPSPDGQGTLAIQRGIEVGHVFQLGAKYSEKLKVNVLDEKGKNRALLMGCYGIGVSRIVAAAIEQNHDDRGIIWTDTIAPWSLVIVPLNARQSDRVSVVSDEIYDFCQASNISVLLDDRDDRPGAKFADTDLIGCPHCIIIGNRSLQDGMIEYKCRSSGKSEHWKVSTWQQRILEKLKPLH